jgi:hypothetical protein
MAPFGSALRRACVVLALISVPAGAQTTGVASSERGIGLTPDHKRMIYRETATQELRPAPSDMRVAIGAEIPDSLMLNEMPIAAKDRAGVLRDFKFAKLPDETIVIVDPAKRQIVDIITREEGTGSQNSAR